jgi:hypothetical protein
LSVGPRSSESEVRILPGAYDDESDSYADILASKLKRGNNRADIVTYLTARLVEHDDAITLDWLAKCEQVATHFSTGTRRPTLP